MPELTLAYRCCDRKLPRYIKHSEVEGIAVLARQQLVDASTDAVSLSVLRDISSLKINGIRFDLWVDIEHAVNDEQGNPVLGVCEFDPDASPDATMLSVSPVSETASEELVLSTFAHELGHAIFDAPSWHARHTAPRLVTPSTWQNSQSRAQNVTASLCAMSTLRSCARTNSWVHCLCRVSICIA